MLKSLYHFDDTSGQLEIEQVSLVLGPNDGLSFQEREGDELDPIRERLCSNKGRIRRHSRLFYELSLWL